MIFVESLCQAYTALKIDGATPKKVAIFVRGHDKPIHGICDIYFPGGICLHLKTTVDAGETSKCDS